MSVVLYRILSNILTLKAIAFENSIKKEFVLAILRDELKNQI